MPETITTAFVQQYQNTMRLLCQQAESRLEGTTIPPIKVDGEYLYWERLGPTEAIELLTRHDNTPNIEQEHTRRRQGARKFIWATLLDEMDAAQMLVDPKGPYQENAQRAMRRRKDRLILEALGGSAWTGKTGTTEVALPAAQKIAHGSQGMTLTKLLTAKQMLDEAEAPDDGRIIVFTAADERSLLTTTEVKSADYNTVRALVDGKVDTFLGFKFIKTELIYKENSSAKGGTWYDYAYCDNAIGFGTLQDITVRLTERADKNYAWQPFVAMHMGATRVEDELVIEIACQ